MDMEEALRRGVARLDGQPERLLSHARALAGQGAPAAAVIGAEGSASAPLDPVATWKASRAALGASHTLLSEAIALLARRR
ncbi:hypothetical protein BKE38_17610 [Pseudoroseomonas deserti]|uniref:Uncharacterized protein n=1 Tax=Teichococcus deserti TaxID=1817963 RepID=A0A1V2GZE1_9PROT|nr:hypothetical protein [Pseudoroseomonas deserti]ONG50633.1 hypothetical protein BKE38_17610 [Pseudoroseomonas deserti]